MPKEMNQQLPIGLHLTKEAGGGRSHAVAYPSPALAYAFSVNQYTSSIPVPIVEPVSGCVCSSPLVVSCSKGGSLMINDVEKEIAQMCQPFFVYFRTDKERRDHESRASVT